MSSVRYAVHGSNEGNICNPSSGVVHVVLNMTWLCIVNAMITLPWLIGVQMDVLPQRGTLYGFPAINGDNDFVTEMESAAIYSRWSKWGPCLDSHRVRRKHCLLFSVCDNALRIEVKSCHEPNTGAQVYLQPLKVTSKKQINETEKIGIISGFSSWSPWSACSRKCTTIRQRLCANPVICGNKLLQQTAYCYRNGGFCKKRIQNRIHRVNYAGESQYQVAFCGGTLISSRWVVTAAHCVRNSLYVRLGDHDLYVRDQGELEMKVLQTIIHPNYDPDTVINDVAMLRLPDSARVRLGHGIACLPHPKEVLPPRTSCYILGWGKRRASDSHGTRILQEAQVSTISQSVCRRSYWQYAITDGMVCAGRGRTDSCAGDSGGPLLCRKRNRYYLQGITSFGDGCGKRGKYGIYTRTARYVIWIHHVMNNKYFNN